VALLLKAVGDFLGHVILVVLGKHGVGIEDAGRIERALGHYALPFPEQIRQETLVSDGDRMIAVGELEMDLQIITPLDAARGDKAADQRPVNQNAGPDSVDTLIDAVNFLFFNASTFVCETGFSSMNPLTPIPIYWTILQLHETMNTFGLWYLPALYGMLGACVYHMRRFLDPSAPNPSWTRTAFRIFLGAFAGIVVVWFWSPTAQKGVEQAASTLSAFTVAFLVGFSIDIFFQALDRLVTKVSQAIG